MVNKLQIERNKDTDRRKNESNYRNIYRYDNRVKIKKNIRLIIVYKIL